MRLLLIDNYDSFTYLLVQYFEELACDLTVVTESENLSQVIRTSPDLICQIYDAIIISQDPKRLKKRYLVMKSFKFMLENFHY